MIIVCPNCKKKFNIDPALVPDKGRDLQCGSCKHFWFYKAENENSLPLTLNENFADEETKENLSQKNNEIITQNKDSIIEQKPKNIEKKIKDISDNKKKEIKQKSIGGKFFSYLIVLIISFVAFIILVDTLKAPIINVFPSVEIILFNLFETLQDIKLFIIDLS